MLRVFLYDDGRGMRETPDPAEETGLLFRRMKWL